MDTPYYLDKFSKVVEKMDKAPFIAKDLQLKAGLWRDSVVLKIQKPSWVNQPQIPLLFSNSFFFSIWVSDKGIAESKLYYNLHALKLRELKGYSIQSREFAQAFRERFKVYEPQWPNVSVNFGPQTLMEGWVKLDPENLETMLSGLSHQFLTIQFIIDDMLEERRK